MGVSLNLFSLTDEKVYIENIDEEDSVAIALKRATGGTCASVNEHAPIYTIVRTCVYVRV